MKLMRIVFMLTAMIAFTSGCEQQTDFVRNYPRVLTTSIERNDSEGLSVTAQFEDQFINTVEEYGIVWGLSEALLVDQNATNYFGQPSSGTIHVTITDRLSEGTEYYFRVFLVASKKVIYGPLTKFTSGASFESTITGVSPTLVQYADTVTITGSGFGSNLTRTSVSFKSGVYSATGQILEITTNEIKVAFPNMRGETFAVTVSTQFGEKLTFPVTLTRKFPALTSITSTDNCSEIILGGENLKSFDRPTKLLINDRFVNQTAVQPSTISIDRSFHGATIRVRMEYLNGYYVVEKEFEDPATLPVVVGSLVTTIPEDSMFTLDGTSFPACGGLSINAVFESQVDTGLFEIIEITSSKITFRIKSQVCESFKVDLLYNDVSIYTSDTIEPDCD